MDGERNGLSPQHHGELNNILSIRPGRYDELRAEYSEDTLALEQIDIYEYVPAYAEHIDILRKALIADDKETIDKVQAWFEQHYPETTKRTRITYGR